MEYKGKLFGKVGESLFPLIETTEDIDILKQKLKNAEAALRDIERWDDDFAYEWGDPGERAADALRDNDKLTIKET